MVKKKEERDKGLKVKTDEERKKAKEQRKLKLKEYITRGEKWYKADTAEKKDLVELKRKVIVIITYSYRPVVQATTTSQLRLRSHSS